MSKEKCCNKKIFLSTFVHSYSLEALSEASIRRNNRLSFDMSTSKLDENSLKRAKEIVLNCSTSSFIRYFRKDLITETLSSCYLDIEDDGDGWKFMHKFVAHTFGDSWWEDSYRVVGCEKMLH